MMQDNNGDITVDATKMHGRPTKYKTINPEYILFVDETGCNTNQKDDGYAAGQMFVLPVGSMEGVRIGAVTDLHFTVFCFST